MPTPTNVPGPEAAAVAVANTLTTFLNAKLDAHNALWNDGTNLVHPKKIYPYQVFEVPEYPAVMCWNADGHMVGNMATVYQSMEHRVVVQAVCMSDNKTLLQKQVLRYLVAIQQTLAEHQRLDGTLMGAFGVSVGNYATSQMSEKRGAKGGMGSQMMQAGYWLVTVGSEEMLP